jgi:UDP-3-O-[3-hydroxymyristoyl] glucosamine N-acyltransferase
VSISTGEIAKALEGKLIGSPDVQLEGVSEIALAMEKEIVVAFEKKHLEKAPDSKAGAFLLTEEIKGLEKPQIIIKNGRLGLAKLLTLFFPQVGSQKEDIHSTAVIASSVKIGKQVTVGPHAVIEANVEIGDNVYIGANVFVGENSKIDDDSVIYPNVSIYAKTEIGKRVRINSGSAIGIDGFGYVQDKGQNIKIPQVGKVVLEDDVELCGSNTIARATLTETRIGAGTKIDSLVHIGHNVKVGKNCIFVASSACGGNASVGNNVIVAGMSAISDHVNIADNTIIMASSVVVKDTKPGDQVMGFPAKDYKKETKNMAIISKLSNWIDRIKAVEKKIKE